MTFKVNYNWQKAPQLIISSLMAFNALTAAVHQSVRIRGNIVFACKDFMFMLKHLDVGR